MTSIWTLIGLLGLAYLGSAMLGPRGAARFGLSSGVEFVLLGVAIGPLLLGVLERSTLGTFEPVAGVATGWFALLIGLGFGWADRRRVPTRSLVLGIVIGLVTGASVFGALYGVLGLTRTLTGADRLLVAGGVGAACAGTTRHVARWMVARHGARGSFLRLVAEIADADDAVAIVATAVLFALHPTGEASVRLAPWSWGALSLGLGTTLGLTATALLGRDFRLDASWGTLLGTGLLGIGLSAQLGLSPLTTMFAMGLTIALVSRHRAEIVEMTRPTERAVLLPALVLAGAKVDVAAPSLIALVVTTAVVRVVVKGFAGLALRGAIGPRVPPWAGIGLVSTGGLSMSVALAFALRFPGWVGDSVLATTAAVLAIGELLGPPVLRAALDAAGEIRPAGPTSFASAPSLPPPPPETVQ
jgi:Kef-type K+ transport system membrane component KefB